MFEVFALGGELFDVAIERLGVCEEVVREEDWLGVLEVCAFGYDGVEVRGCLCGECVDEVDEEIVDCVCVVLEEHLDECCDLVVLALVRAEFVVELGLDDVDEYRFECAVDVFVGVDVIEFF